MKELIRKSLFFILAAVFVFSTAMLLLQFMDNAGGEETYGDARVIASGSKPQENVVQPTQIPTEMPIETAPVVKAWVPAPVKNDPVMEEMAAIDLAALRVVNEDVIGWIRIPDTKVDYPIMHGEDNDYYLKHTWDRKDNAVGSIFLEHLNSPDLTDYNTIVYGHNMIDGSMFAQLHKFTNQEYWEEHPYVYITTDAGVYRYDIFAAYRAEVEGATYGLSFNQKKTKVDFLKYAAENTQIQTQVSIGEHDRILTLSTCSGGGYTTRWVVQARLKMVEVQQ